MKIFLHSRNILRGGHQNVAGAQVKGRAVESVFNEAIEEAKAYIEEYDQDESDSAAGR